MIYHRFEFCWHDFGLFVHPLEVRLQDWAKQVVAGCPVETWTGLTLDGNTLRASQADEQGAVHLLSAFLHDLEVVLGQQAVGDKANEIPTARDHLKTLTLERMLVTGDGLHTQRETAELIVKKRGPI